MPFDRSAVVDSMSVQSFWDEESLSEMKPARLVQNWSGGRMLAGVAATPEKTVQFVVSKSLNKPLDLPSRSQWSIHPDDLVITGKILCYTKSKGFLMSRMTQPALRHAAITTFGYLIIYEKDDKGYVIDISKANRLDSINDTMYKKKSPLRRCQLKLKLPFGSVLVFLLEETITPWRDAILNIYNGTPTPVQTKKENEVAPCTPRQSSVREQLAIEPSRETFVDTARALTPLTIRDSEEEINELSSAMSSLSLAEDSDLKGEREPKTPRGLRSIDGSEEKLGGRAAREETGVETAISDSDCNITDNVSVVSGYAPVATLCKRIELRIKKGLRWKKKERRPNRFLKRNSTRRELVCLFPPEPRPMVRSASCRSCVSLTSPSSASSVVTARSSFSSTFPSIWSLPNLPSMLLTEVPMHYEYFENNRRKTIAVCDCGQSFA